MNMKWKRGMGKAVAVCLAGAAALMLVSCGNKEESGVNLVVSEDENERIVNMFSPMEKIDPDAENVARNASDMTVCMAEEKLGIKVAYNTYTAEDHQDKTYDEVAVDRARNNMDDIYLLNPDTIRTLGEEGKLLDLSGLELKRCGKNSEYRRW